MRRMYLPAALAVAVALTVPATAGVPGGAITADTDLRAAVAVAERATRVQAGQLGITAIPPVDLPSVTPSAAVLALAARYGVTPDSSQRAAVRALDSLPTAARDALANVVSAYGAFDLAARANPSDNAAAVFGARVRMLREAVALEESLGAGSSKAPINLCPAIAVDLAGTGDTYTDRCALVIDVAGDDTYLNNAGGSNVLGVQLPNCGGATTGAGALFDLGGTDRYTSGGDCGVNGGANGGAGFLLDTGGNDIYTGRAAGVNGGANGGYAFLLDVSGHDDYNAGNFGVNGGAGWQGSGLLIDGGGNDQYGAGSWGVNGGAHQRGVAALVDLSGTDSYSGDHSGANGGADPLSLGSGLLLDGGGIGDTYLDNEGGTGTDTTVAPKGPVGSQLDYPVRFPGNAPTWVDRTVLSRSVPINTPAVPAVNADLVRIEGRRSTTDPRNYEIRVYVNGQPLPTNPVSVFTSGLLAAPIDVSLVRTPAIASIPAELRFTLRHRYDPTQVVCLFGVGSTCVNAPVDPLNIAWLSTSGAQAQLVVDAAVLVNNQVIASQSVPVPYAGQLLAGLP